MTVTNVTVSSGTPQTATAGRRTSQPAAVSGGTSLTANFVIDPAAAEGPTHGDGHDGGRDQRRGKPSRSVSRLRLAFQR